MSKLSYWQDSLVGEIGFSFTEDNLISVANSLVEYSNENNIDITCIGYDNRLFADKFAKCLIDALCVRGSRVRAIDTPCPVFLLSWLSGQVDKGKKSIGVYIGGDSSPIGMLSLSFKNSDGSPFNITQTKEIYNSYVYHLKCSSVFVVEGTEPEYIDITEGYSQWMLDNNEFDLNGSNIIIDCLTSPCEIYIKRLFNKLGVGQYYIPGSRWSAMLATNRFRPLPTGWVLKDSFSNINYPLCISFDGDADCIGVYDGINKEELSPSAVFILLIHYLAKIKKRSGTILVSRAVSERVRVVAEKLGFNIETIDGGLAGLSESLKVKRKRKPLMYGDEYGGFWFKNTPLDRNPIIAILYLLDLQKITGLTPGKLYDKIVNELLDRKYFYANLDLLPTEVNKEYLNKLLNGEFLEIKYKGKIYDNYTFTSFEFIKDLSRVVIQSNPKNGYIELYCESESKESLEETISSIQSYIFYDDTFQ